MSSVGDLLDGYDTIAAWDEMFDAAGGPRPHYRTLYEQVQTSSWHYLNIPPEAAGYDRDRVWP